MAIQCWAKSLGDCSPQQSREHYISASLFEGPTIKVQGFSWCVDKQIEIGLSSAVSKILCKHHNEILSPVDQAGAQVFDTFRKIRKLEMVRDRLKPHRWHIIRHDIDGPILERWFIKTAINLVCVQTEEVHWLESSTPRFEPPSLLVDVVFGKRSLPPDMGLFFAVHEGQAVETGDHINFAPLVLNEGVAAGLFEFRGFRFLISLWNQPMPKRPLFLNNLPEGWDKACLLPRVEHLYFNSRGYPSQKLTIKWPKLRIA